MNEMAFSFGEAPWESVLNMLEPGGKLSAAQLLTLLEEEDEQSVEDALLALQEKRILPDLSDLPVTSGSGETALRLRQEAQLVHKGLRPESLEETDPLRLYLEELAAVPAFGDAQLLAEKAAAGDEEAMVALTNLRLSRVIELAGEHAGQGVLLLDLIQEGSLGLWQAIQSWESGDFEQWSDWFIRFSMAKAVLLQARAGGVGQKLRAAMEDYRSVDEQLLSELGRSATPEELAQRLHIRPEEAETVGKMMENVRLMAQVKKTPDPEPEEEQEEQQAVEDTAYFQARQRIQELLSQLPEADAKLLTLRYGLEGGRALSPADAGRRLGLTPEEVVAREGAALALLRRN